MRWKGNSLINIQLSGRLVFFKTIEQRRIREAIEFPEDAR
jgi:hypothetical protein